MALTQTEAWFLDECIKGEKIICGKLAAACTQVQDPALRQLFQDLHQVHQRHFEMLASNVR